MMGRVALGLDTHHVPGRRYGAASEVWSKSSLAMLEALIDSERDPAVLAQLSRSTMQAKIPALTEALAGAGRFNAHHAVVARQIIDHVAFLGRAISQLSVEIAERASPFGPAIQLLCTIPGVRQTTAETFIAETGGDMSRSRLPGTWRRGWGWPPANHESAGKHRAASGCQGGRWLRRNVVESAWAASRTKNSYLSAQYRRLARRRGPNKAIIAVAHSIIVIAWHMLSNGTPYEVLVADWLDKRSDADSETRRLVGRLESLGHSVTLSPA